MAHVKVLALIMAGGKGSRLEVLTEIRAKPVMPYAGVYRLIDFPLSNCMHSGISDVWVIEQYQPQGLNTHLAGGRPWDLDRTYGGLRLLQPHQGPEDGGWSQGNADTIYRDRVAIREFEPDVVLVLSADHIYKLDYRLVVDQHLAREASVTAVTTRVPREQASRFGNVRVDDDGRITDFEYKPESPRSDLATTEVFVYSADSLLDTLEALCAERESEGGEEGATLGDFGDELLPRLVEQGRAHEYRLDGYWRDVGTVQSYWEAHMDLLTSESGLELDDPRWPILTFGVQRSPARIHESARIADSLISPGCRVSGHVERSILGPGVVVEEGATVRHAILLNDCTVRTGATVDCAILDEGAQVGAGAHVGSRTDGTVREESEIALIGRAAQVAEGARIEAGGRIEPAGMEEATSK